MQTTEAMPTAEEVREALKTVQDPDLRMGIVDLGLIYGVDVVPDAGEVAVTMTLTSPMCPIAPVIMKDVEDTCNAIPGVKSTRVDLVWEPAWDPRTMASEDVKTILGIW